MPERVDPFAIVWVTAPVELGGGGGRGWLVADGGGDGVGGEQGAAVVECAHLEGVLAVAGVVEARGEACRRTAVVSVEHELAVDQELDRARVVLDLSSPLPS